MKDIAIIGPLRSGKDSVYEALRDKYEYIKLSFAAALKEEVLHALSGVENGWTLERIETEKTRLRPLLQWWGTEFRRSVEPDYWVEKVAEEVDRYNAFGERRPLIVTDARFANELQMLKDKGFVIIRLNMTDANLRAHLKRIAGMNAAQVKAALAHPSEQEWKGFPVDGELDSVPGRLDLLIKNAIKAAERLSA